MNEINIGKELEQKTMIELVDLARNSTLERVQRGTEYSERLSRVKSILATIPADDREFLREFFLKNSLFGLSM